MKIKRSTFAKGFAIFVALSIAVMVFILVWTTDKDTWRHFRDFQWSYVPLLLGIFVIRWYIDGMAFVTMAKHGSKANLKVGRAAAIRLQGHTLTLVVPFLVGTFSMHTYQLHKEKMTVSESMAISVLRAILPILLFLINIPILIWMRDDLGNSTFFSQFIKVISLPLLLIMIFFIITLFYPERIKKAASSIVRWWGRIKILHVERIIRMEEKLFHEIDQFSKIFWFYFRERKFMMIKATGWILAAIISDYFFGIVILWGFGYHPPLLKLLAIQFLMRPLIFLAPTPGGTGVWDFTYLGFFSTFMPKHLIGVGVLLWRIMMTYLPSLVGAFLLTREFHRDKNLKEMMLDKGKLPEEKLEDIDVTEIPDDS